MTCKVHRHEDTLAQGIGISKDMLDGPKTALMLKSSQAQGHICLQLLKSANCLSLFIFMTMKRKVVLLHNF